MAATTIDDVLEQLADIIADSIKTNDRMGYFAALYYKVTASVRAGIAKGLFTDGVQMEKFDVIFASRYLDALSAWKNKQPLSASWQVAFEATRSSSALILQQLLLGMNAHINLDLGIAAAEVSGGQLAGVQKDFDAINTIISALTYQVVNDIDRMSPLLSLLGLHYNDQTSILIQFSIDNARDGAWCFAEELVTKQGADYNTCITQRDQTITKLADGLIHMKGFMRLTVWVIHLFEWKNAAKIINALHEDSKQKIVVG
ncbi:hypothetical protein KXD93_11730 [Mucilaginibacter sp. BJC16-A38]|uniref:DUF5995 family protein n=1 Tax=Mucilaginibacter phenanthrenivorans TaxID=1234842 RepID=UPI002157E554|nr:DUF5995 family protein [Mucilaginibacter phenanthrenivorans]MCR8558321.1 hypothetical protein [Mucilaginibacter phenanthrenivorans]